MRLEQVPTKLVIAQRMDVSRSIAHASNLVLDALNRAIAPRV